MCFSLERWGRAFLKGTVHMLTKKMGSVSSKLLEMQTKKFTVNSLEEQKITSLSK